MSFRAVFIALVVSFALVLAGFLVNQRRPSVETDQASASFVKATGKCAECHTQQHHSIVHEYEMSAHAAKGINCLDCHQAAKGQGTQDHHGFVITTTVTAANCRSCHENEYQQFLRSRHALPSWTAVYGSEGMPRDLVDFSEKFHPGFCDRPPNPLVSLEGEAAVKVGCVKCHAIGKPNDDGSVGTCTSCHTRHTTSISIARLPTTCGQCHMGPDHSQLEIFSESKHGVMFEAQRHLLKMTTKPSKLTTKDMFIPTCATCHMSGLNGLKVTHDVTERLSWNLAPEIATKRPHYAHAQIAMKEVCIQCHTRPVVERVFTEAEKVTESTNVQIKSIAALMSDLTKGGHISKKPFSEPIHFKYFDLWHYYGRTVRHGAFMGGQDYAQWHGAYPLLKYSVEIQAKAKELKEKHGDKSK